MYAILRAAFMSDEPVGGAPSIDAFSFPSQGDSRVEPSRSAVRFLSAIRVRRFLFSPQDRPVLISLSITRAKPSFLARLHLSAGTAGNTIFLGTAVTRTFFVSDPS